MPKCGECGKNGIISYQRWSNEKKKFVGICQTCVNRKRHWHGFLNHTCLCFDNGVTLP